MPYTTLSHAIHCYRSGWPGKTPYREGLGDEGSRLVLKSAINANLSKDLTRIVNHLKLVQAAIRRCSVPRGKLSQTVDEVNSILVVCKGLWSQFIYCHLCAAFSIFNRRCTNISKEIITLLN